MFLGKFRLSLAPGYQKVIYPALVVALVLYALFLVTFHIWLCYIGIIWTFLVGILIYFYRDPQRIVNLTSSALLAPADGTVTYIENQRRKLSPTDADATIAYTIRIRMTLFNVHVNRSPLSGKIVEIKKLSGSYWPFIPYLNKGSKNNARQIIKIENDLFKVDFVQIAGFLARQCVSFKKIGEFVEQGEKIGMIRLGSEVELVIYPKSKNINLQWRVNVGDKTTAGITPIATIITTNET